MSYGLGKLSQTCHRTLECFINNVPPSYLPLSTSDNIDISDFSPSGNIHISDPSFTFTNHDIQARAICKHIRCPAFTFSRADEK